MKDALSGRTREGRRPFCIDVPGWAELAGGVEIIWPGIGIMLHNGFEDKVERHGRDCDTERNCEDFLTKITCENLLIKSRDKLTYSSSKITIV